MNFLQESVLRRYFAFLLLFLALLTGFGILYGTNCIQAEKNLLLAHDRAFVSSLLEEDIPPETILRALKQAKETERGAALLRQSGWTERTSALFLPQVRQAAAVSMGTAVGGVLLLALFLMGGSLFFLTRLDRLYRRNDSPEAISLAACRVAEPDRSPICSPQWTNWPWHCNPKARQSARPRNFSRTRSRTSPTNLKRLWQHWQCTMKSSWKSRKTVLPFRNFLKRQRKPSPEWKG